MINKFRYKKPPSSPNQNNNNEVRKVQSICSTTNSSTKSSTSASENQFLDKPNLNTGLINESAPLLDDKTRNNLKELFSQLQFSTETALPPDALRRALAESFFDQQRFQLGFMDDAAECFENMLLRIHTHIANGEAEDMCSAKHCIPHQKFAMTLVEQSVCGSCGASSEPLSYTQMVHYVSTSTLVYQVRNNTTQNRADAFGQLLRKAGNMGDVRVCPSACGAVIQIGRTLMNHPEIVSVGLVWNSERPSLEHIMEVFSTIGTTLRLKDVFNTVVDNRWADTSMHNLVGVVTYYGKHYSTFFFHTKLRVWIYFDDATVREVGPRWEQVVEKCRKGRYQPLLLLYALPDGTPVNTENAPKQVTPFYNKNGILRRSVTPSPEKPMMNANVRRAITPNPDGSLINQKPPLPRPYNDYQNLSVIQKNIYPSPVDTVDGYVRKASVHRTLSSGSSSGVEADSRLPPRRRDSGNWSGDRNSASSASSTTMENPYLYLVGKVPPGSPTRTKSDSSSGSSAVYDAGYDSYSLSSNDSSTMSTLQHLMKMGHLAKIPEDYNSPSANISQSCDVLCDEADELLVKSRQLEDEHDLVLALALCNAAATKARAAMNAPYNNPQTLTLARMKHNTCIMRARSLHRRMTQTPQSATNGPVEIRHTREGSSGSGGRHSRQSSRDKTGMHSRQNSRELLADISKEKVQPTKSIEIYATLPKKRDKQKIFVDNTMDFEDIYDKPPVRESRSIFSRKNKDKVKEKRSRSEDRNKISRDFSITSEIIVKDSKKEAKEKDKDGKDPKKKQHKIRRKLLMGGLIKRKNRSMPDLTNDEPTEVVPTKTVDDSAIIKSKSSNSMCGYLSEGHLEFTAGNCTNPNLERSKLMRKSFHGSAGKILTAAKVPPPPPLRTTSQLSKAKLGEQVAFAQEEPLRPKCPLPENFYDTPPKYFNTSSSSTNSYDTSNNTVITMAEIHQEQSPDSGVDEVDCFPARLGPNLDLPPYPSPMGSVVHSRQASEEFPPPPPPLDLSALDEHLPKSAPSPPPAPDSLLAQLQNKRLQILSSHDDTKKEVPKVPASIGGDTWLRELQAKQAALRLKKENTNADNNTKSTVDLKVGTEKLSSTVKDLASKFEADKHLKEDENKKPTTARFDFNMKSEQNGVLTMKKREDEVPPEQIAEEIREVEMLSAAVNKTLGQDPINLEEIKRNRAKKKSVSFCDQVILVATAEEQEDDSYIPNPILERVLRTAMNKPESAAIRQEIINLRENEQSNDEITPIPSPITITNNPSPVPQNPVTVPANQPQTVYMRRNSLDNLLNRPDSVPYPANYTQQQQMQIPQYPNQQYHHQNNQNITQNGANYNQNSNVNVQNQYPQSTNNNNNQYYGNGSTNSVNQYPQNVQNMNNELYQQPPNSTNRYHQQNLNGTTQYNHSQYSQNQYVPNCNGVNQCPPNCNGGTTQYPAGYQQQNPALNQYPNTNQYQNSTTAQYSPINGGTQYVQNPVPPYSTSQYQQNNTPPQNGGVQTSQYHQNYNQYHQQSQSPMNMNSSNGTTNQYHQRQSPYQPIPSNSAAYTNYYAAKPPSGANPNVQRQEYSSPPVRSSPYQQIRQSTPSPLNVGYNPVYQHPPSPAPSNSSNFHYNTTSNNNNNQRINNDYNEYKSRPDVYQRVPPPHSNASVDTVDYPLSVKYATSPYQHALPPKQPIIKKSVSFEPGTKGGCESPTPKAVVTPIVVNNANNSIPTDRTKCNLCRKKNVVAANLYCTDCEFYMSRFKPRS